MDIESILNEHPVLRAVSRGEEVVWINPDRTDIRRACEGETLSMRDIDDAEARWQRFAPFLMKRFPEMEKTGGIIESPLTPIPAMRERLCRKYRCDIPGTLLLKQDSHLAIAGSVKARGGIYEVLKHTEELALQNGLLHPGDDYSVLASDEARAFFGRYTVQVGSTGNLGMSIGIMSAAVGYKAVVHMSADARQWKKDMLRSRGVTVIEYASDYSEAVKNGRAMSDADPMSYFVDDENSQNLFLGYAVAAKRLVGQLRDLDITPDAQHPLFVYLPCGVGGAPGGIAFGLRHVFGDAVHCFFVEPTQAPCMLAGMASGLHSGICVQDLGLTGHTHADGLAVGRPSGFVGQVMRRHVSGEFTVADARLYDYMRDLLETEDIFIEPSACAAFRAPVTAMASPAVRDYIEREGLTDSMSRAAHIVWATGGSLVPAAVREEYANTHL